MFFEGSEKKFEVVVKGAHFLDWPEAFWRELVSASQAQILSGISTQSCRAFLLSESSLFVWQDRITMITCGQTDLIAALELFLKKVPKETVDFMIYERKNEYFPYFQKSHIFNDFKRLKNLFPGEAFQFGNSDDHHLFIFSTEKSHVPQGDDATLEVLMYGLQGKAKELFAESNTTKDQVRQDFNLFKSFPGYEVDDFLFDPMGYSLNALSEESYYTVHVTPQEQSPYVSFETNMKTTDNYKSEIEKVLKAFQPQSYDVVLFHPEKNIPLSNFKGYRLKDKVQDCLPSGYFVSYGHFYEPNEEIKNAYRVNIEE